MTQQRLLLSACLVALLCGAPSARAGMAVTPDKENVVASRLVGQWTVEPALTKRLGGRPGGEAGVQATVEFVSDPDVATRVPEKIAKALAKFTVFMAGTMRTGGKAYPFLLIAHKGNPHLLYFRERNGDPMGDTESFNLMLAVARQKASDLLFVGGDMNNQPFTAYQRAAKATLF